MTPLVELWDSVGLGLIVEYPSGILYSNQTGGYSCLHPRLEGVYVPLRNDTEESTLRFISPETELFAYFTGSIHQGSGAVSGLSADDADVIDGVLRKASLSDIISIDRTRLAESHEAWVRVTVTAEEQRVPVFTGLGPYPRPGVLTWSNSD